MKKFTFCLTALLLMSTVANAQYVRKVVRPNFFIPEKELNRVEKLPPFPQTEQEDTQEDIHYVIPAKQEKDKSANTSPNSVKTSDMTQNQENAQVKLLKIKLHDQQNPETITEKEEDEEQINKPSDDEERQNLPPMTHRAASFDLPVAEEKIIPDMSSVKIDENFEQTESYQNIKQEYENDLKTIAKTGKSPENRNVSEALQKMNSDDILWVDDTTFE